ncbi:MAG: S9 family peptidase, partial [Massilia sp.]
MLKRALPWLCVLVLGFTPCLAAEPPSAVAGATATAASREPAIGSFFANPQYSDAKLSPDGALVAVRVKRANRDALVVIDLADSSRTKVVAHYADGDIGHFEWVNNNRLIFDTTDNQLALGERYHAAGLFAVDRDGSNVLPLASRTPYIDKGKKDTPYLPGQTYMMSQAGAQNSDSVYVIKQTFDEYYEPDGYDLYLVNTLTTHATKVPSKHIVQCWVLDHKGEPRLAISTEMGVTAIYHIEPETKVWRKLVDFPAYKGGAGAFSPLGFGPDGTLYVSAHQGKDKLGLYRYDLANARIDPSPVLQVDDYDFDGELIASADKLLGVQLLTDGESDVWFDPAMKALQAKIDTLLPETVNLIT